MSLSLRAFLLCLLPFAMAGKGRGGGCIVFNVPMAITGSSTRQEALDVLGYRAHTMKPKQLVDAIKAIHEVFPRVPDLSHALSPLYFGSPDDVLSIYPDLQAFHPDIHLKSNEAHERERKAIAFIQAVLSARKDHDRAVLLSEVNPDILNVSYAYFRREELEQSIAKFDELQRDTVHLSNLLIRPERQEVSSNVLSYIGTTQVYRYQVLFTRDIQFVRSRDEFTIALGRYLESRMRDYAEDLIVAIRGADIRKILGMYPKYAAIMSHPYLWRQLAENDHANVIDAMQSWNQLSLYINLFNHPALQAMQQTAQAGMGVGFSTLLREAELEDDDEHIKTLKDALRLSTLWDDTRRVIDFRNFPTAQRVLDETLPTKLKRYIALQYSRALDVGDDDILASYRRNIVLWWLSHTEQIPAE